MVRKSFQNNRYNNFKRSDFVIRRLLRIQVTKKINNGNLRKRINKNDRRRRAKEKRMISYNPLEIV